MCVARRAHEVAALEEFAEPRIISKGIPLGIPRQPGEVHIVVRVGAPEPREREIALAEPGMLGKEHQHLHHLGFQANRTGRSGDAVQRWLDPMGIADVEVVLQTQYSMRRL